MPSASRSSRSVSPGWMGSRMSSILSMIDFGRPGAALGPFEANPPLVVDANAPLPPAPALERFQTVAGARQAGEGRNPTVPVERFGPLVGEADDYGRPLSSCTRTVRTLAFASRITSSITRGRRRACRPPNRAERLPTRPSTSCCVGSCPPNLSILKFLKSRAGVGGGCPSPTCRGGRELTGGGRSWPGSLSRSARAGGEAMVG